MGKFMFRSCKGFAAAVSAGVFLLAVAAFAIGCLQGDREHQQSAGNSGSQTAIDIPENPLQIILSLGAEPGQLSISWKGDADRPEPLQQKKNES